MQNAQQTAMIRPVQMQRVASTRIGVREDLTVATDGGVNVGGRRVFHEQKYVKWLRVSNRVDHESYTMWLLYPHIMW